jgi:hypothetical protein
MQLTQKLEQKTIEEMLDVHPDLLTTNTQKILKLLELPPDIYSSPKENPA